MNPPADQNDDRALLIRIDERVRNLSRQMDNHLAHHWAITVCVASAAITAIGSLVVGLIRLAG